MDGADLEAEIGHWRAHLRRHAAISDGDLDEMEDHLREQVADLRAAGLSDDEAFVVAVKRMGQVDALSREFAREHSDRLWKQLGLTGTSDGAGGPARPDPELSVVLALAVAAGVFAKVGLALLGEAAFVRNASVLVLPFLTGYFAWKRQVSLRAIVALAAPFAVMAAVLNLYPMSPDRDTTVLATLHAPVALWFVVGVAYVGGAWRSDRRRMDFVRFTGEFAIYYTLLALGGGVLLGLTVATFATVGLNAETAVADWVLPFAVPGAALVAAWLVEAKQSVVENLAPVLTRVFTPLTILMLVALLVALAWSGSDLVNVDRNLLILMDLVLVLVLGLLLYAISAREPESSPGFFDRLQLVLVLCALVVDLVTLTAMLTRIAEFGSSPNKVTALGLNLVLLGNLAWSARLSAATSFGRRDRSGAAALERWQTRYLPTYGVWAALVVAAIPPAFGFA